MRVLPVLISVALLAAAPAFADTKASADTKAGVDAWSHGDYAKAVAAWRPAANAGDADAQFNLAQAYKLGRGVPADLAQAEAWYRKAAVQGHFEAETNYGLVLFQENKRTDAVPWLEKAVARGEPRAQLVLGTMLYNGDAVPRDWPRAYALIVRSAASGSERASGVQAEMDRYISADDRQKGLALARQYEAEAKRPALPPELASAHPAAPARPAPAAGPIRKVDVPPSPYDPHAHSAEAKAQPAPRPAAPHTPVVTVGGGWRLQLGAFRDEGNARGLWQSLKTRVAPLRDLQPFFVRAGAVTRLQAGPLASKAEATRACAAVKPTGTACVVVAPQAS